MKLLLDENLSDRIVGRIVDLYPDSEHVKTSVLTNADDASIWDYAKINSLIIIFIVSCGDIVHIQNPSPKTSTHPTRQLAQSQQGIEATDRFAKDFVYQWLDLEKLKIIEPDVNIFTVDEFDLVRDQIKEEPVEFFKELLSSNLSLVNFIDSDFVTITPELNYI